MIASFDAVNAMLAEIGPAIDARDIVIDVERCRWTVAVDRIDSNEIVIDYDAAREELTARTSLGPVNPVQIEDTYAFMLTFNARQNGPGAVRLGIEGPGGDAVLIFKLSLRGIDARTLTSVLREVETLAPALQSVIGLGVNFAASPVSPAAVGWPCA